MCYYRTACCKFGLSTRTGENATLSSPIYGFLILRTHLFYGQVKTLPWRSLLLAIVNIFLYLSFLPQWCDLIYFSVMFSHDYDSSYIHTKTIRYLLLAASEERCISVLWANLVYGHPAVPGKKRMKCTLADIFRCITWTPLWSTWSCVW